MPDIIDLNKQIRESPALQVHFFLGELNTNHYVVARNFQELHKFLETVESPESFSQLWAKGKKDELHAVMREITRLLLNFLASVGARVESTRHMMRRRYKGQPIFEQYQKEIERLFKGDFLAEFVEGLRNYSLHYALPFAGAKWQYSQKDGMRHFFTLDREVLLSSSYFKSESKKGRAYLEQAQGEIVIHEFIMQYFVRIHNFQAWLEHELREKHREELDWLYATSGEIDAEMTKLRGSLRFE